MSRVPACVLVVGSGAREHALAWRLASEAGVDRVIVAPGNPGMTDVAETRSHVPSADQGAVARLARDERADLVVVGPEGPLVEGLAETLREAGIPVFGPSAAAAALEGSKAFCREVATEAGVPMAEGEVFDAVRPALAWAHRMGAPVVVKADGLAAGKGVTVCETLADVERALEEALTLEVFGPAGRRVVLERALDGREASVMALCDETAILVLPSARDHKRLGEGDSGPNTGGMGAISPVPELTDDDTVQLLDRFHRPVLAALARRGIPFRGALYAGLMLTDGGPRLLEFNVRLGDPEAQAILPRVAAPLSALLLAAAQGRLASAAADLGLGDALVPACAEAVVAVVLASAGYPGTPRTGDPIEGLGDALSTGATVFHGATSRRQPDGMPLTAGGRVLTVVGRGANVAEAAGVAHGAADAIRFSGVQRRRDIGRDVATSATGVTGPTAATGVVARPTAGTGVARPTAAAGTAP